MEFQWDLFYLTHITWLHFGRYGWIPQCRYLCLIYILAFTCLSQLMIILCFISILHTTKLGWLSIWSNSWHLQPAGTFIVYQVAIWNSHRAQTPTWIVVFYYCFYSHSPDFFNILYSLFNKLLCSVFGKSTLFSVLTHSDPCCPLDSHFLQPQ
jgi:hypothetical protein